VAHNSEEAGYIAGSGLGQEGYKSDELDNMFPAIKKMSPGGTSGVFLFLHELI
jgi:hypothetical protein